MTPNFLGVTFLMCFYCLKDLPLGDTIDYCDYRCHHKDYELKRKKQKRTDLYFKG